MKRNSGLELIEIMVIVAICGILTALIIGAIQKKHRPDTVAATETVCEKAFCPFCGHKL